MYKTELLTIFATYGKIDIVKKVLPSVIKETKKNDAKLIVHDSTEPYHGQNAKWEYLKTLNSQNDFFLILSSNMSMAHARNMCLKLGQELYAPEYISILEDDHGYKDGIIPIMIESTKQYYGKMSPNGLRYGMFTSCYKHTNAKLKKIDDMHAFPIRDNRPFDLGGCNSCLRFSTTSHWNNVLKGYDTDEYLISEFQTSNLRWRNYHKGFTVMFVGKGELVFSFDEGGRGVSLNNKLKLYDKNFCASDFRSRYLYPKEKNTEFELSKSSNMMIDINNNQISNSKKDLIKRLSRRFLKGIRNVIS